MTGFLTPRRGFCLITALAILVLAGCDTLPAPFDNDNQQSQAPNDNSTGDSGDSANDNAGQDDGAVRDPSPAGQALQALEDASSTRLVVAFDDEAPSHVEARVLLESFDPQEPVSGAIEYLEKFRELYRLEEPAAQLYPDRIVSDDTGTHVFFRQQLNGISVYRAELAVHIQDGMVVSTNGHYLPGLENLGAPVLSSTEAVSAAASVTGGTVEDLMSAPERTYFNGRLFGHPDSKTRLVWRFSMRQGCDAMGGCRADEYFVDAMSGEVIHVEPGAHDCDKDFDINHANGTTSSTCWNAPWETADDEMYDEDGRWCGVFEGCATTTPDGFNAFNHAHRVYDHFAATYGRCGWDGHDAQLEVMVHVGFNPANAEYNRGCDYLAFSDGFVVLDAFAHEYTHAITRWTCGLGGTGEPGSLNEHYSDVLASMFDSNWTIADGIPGGAVRNMATPSVAPFRDADHMVKAQCGANKGLVPGGDKYSNAGIMNKAAFLMTDGGTHAGVGVAGIRRFKVERLFYHVLTGRLTGNAQFWDARNATVTLAREWWLGGSVHGFTQSDVCSVINAYAAVGLGARDVDCDGYDDFEDNDDDNDGRADSVDNCDFVKNPYQENNDGDAFGDACDDDDDNDSIPDGIDGCPFAFNPDQGDRDGDGVMDACDNCPDTIVYIPGPDYRLVPYANPDQTDTDHDGMGDLCDDDDDNDGVLDDVDNCPLVRNPDQTDLNGDGIGLVCDEVELSALDRENTPPDFGPINPGDCIACGDYFTPDVRTRINVLAPYNVHYRVVDQYGNVAGKVRSYFDTGNGRAIDFEFFPRASALYRFPERVTASPFLAGVGRDETGRRVMQPTQYFIQTLPQPGARAVEPYELTVSTVRGEQ